MGLFQSLFKNKNAKSPYDLSDLGVDVHSHLIPGIDDGSQSMDETIGMLVKVHELGYTKIITTPHVMSDQYQNTPAIIMSGLKEVRSELDKLSINLTIDAAAEYYLDEFLTEKVEKNEVLTFGANYLLFELSFTTPPNLLDQFIFSAKTRNYNPVIAHFERYPYFFDSALVKLEELRGKGVKIQMNALSLTGHYGPHVKRQAELMVDHGFVDLVGTDCHRIEHLNILEKNLTLSYFHKLKELPLINRSL